MAHPTAVASISVASMYRTTAIASLAVKRCELIAVEFFQAVAHG